MVSVEKMKIYCNNNIVTNSWCQATRMYLSATKAQCWLVGKTRGVSAVNLLPLIIMNTFSQWGKHASKIDRRSVWLSNRWRDKLSKSDNQLMTVDQITGSRKLGTMKILKLLSPSIRQAVCPRVWSRSTDLGQTYPMSSRNTPSMRETYLQAGDRLCSKRKTLWSSWKRRQILADTGTIKNIITSTMSSKKNMSYLEILHKITTHHNTLIISSKSKNTRQRWW